MSLGGQARWERITSGLFWTGVVFVVLAGYRVYDGDDFWGVVMTVAPGALCFALWKLISMWLDGIVAGGQRRWIASMVLVGALVVAVFGIAAEEEESSEPAAAYMAPALDPDIEIVEVPLADGTMVKSLGRKSHPETCAKWAEV